MPKCHCGAWAAFNHIGQVIPLFCSKHKEPNMVNVKSKRCERDRCNKIPSYLYSV